jgi:hypothetical protein
MAGSRIDETPRVVDPVPCSDCALLSHKSGAQSPHDLRLCTELDAPAKLYTSKQMGDACKMLVAAELTLAGIPALAGTT